MKLEPHLNIQAYVDGELSAEQQLELKGLIAKDSALKALAENLAKTKAALDGNEPVIKVPETREFYWSKIAREIEHLEAAKARPAPRPALGMWVRWLAPICGVAAVVAVVVFKGTGPGLDLASTEVDMASPDMGAVTYSDQEAGVTMIWLYDRSSNPFTETGATDTTPGQ